MGAPLFTRRTVEDAAVDLIRAAECLDRTRADSDRIAAALDARWAENREVRQVSGLAAHIPPG